MRAVAGAALAGALMCGAAGNAKAAIISFAISAYDQNDTADFFASGTVDTSHPRMSDVIATVEFANYLAPPTDYSAHLTNVIITAGYNPPDQFGYRTQYITFYGTGAGGVSASGSAFNNGATADDSTAYGQVCLSNSDCYFGGANGGGGFVGPSTVPIPSAGPLLGVALVAFAGTAYVRRRMIGPSQA